MRASEDVPQERVEARRYRALLRSAARVVFVTAPDGAILEPVPDWEAFTGQPFERYRDWGWLGAVHPDDRPAAAAAWRTAVETGSIYDCRYRLRRRDGIHRWMHAHGTPVLDDDGTILEWVGFLADIHEQRTAEVELGLRTSELAALAAIVESTSLAILTKDLDGRILTWNKAAERLSGYTAAEAVGRSIFDILVPEHHHREQEAMSCVRRGEAVQEVELDAVTKAGGRISVVCTISPVHDGAGTVVGSSAIARDVTEQRRLEAALRAEQGLLASLFEAAPVGVALFDAELRYRRVNPVAAEFNRRPLESHIGRTVEEIMPEVAERVTPILRHVLRTGETVAGVELAMPAPDGSAETVGRYLATYFPTARAEDGRVHGVGTVVLDITEHAELQDRLRQAHKMEAIGQLAGGVAHDFNNLLAAILMNCEFLAEALPAESEGHRELDDLCTAARQAANLTRQLLTFSRRQVLAPADIDLNRSVHEVEGLLRRLLGPGIAIETTLAAEPLHVRADPSQMTQVLMNLAVNARDAIPELGSVRIRTGAVSAEEAGAAGAAAPRERPDAEYVVLEVADTGIGMSDEVQAHLFEPFFSTKEPGRGTGLGLATVHYIVVEQAGGFIRVDSAPGEGTRFRLYFPRQRASAAVADRRAARLHDLPRGRETVLVVDDEPEVRHSVRRLLERLGYAVLAAENGAAALALLGSSPGREIDLLLTDVVMPEMGGRELAHQVRRRHPRAGVLFMSGYTQEAIRTDDFPGAPVGFIEKPFTLDAMARQVRSMLDAGAATARTG